MIALDTNVVVRFLTDDDPEQSPRARTILAGLTRAAPGYLCREVMVEIVWVLERAYRYSRTEIAAALLALLEAEELQIEAADRVGLALDRYARGGPGFADQMILIAAAEAGAETLVTFDRATAAAPGGRLAG